MLQMVSNETSSSNDSFSDDRDDPILQVDGNQTYE